MAEKKPRKKSTAYTKPKQPRKNHRGVLNIYNRSYTYNSLFYGIVTVVILFILILGWFGTFFKKPIPGSITDEAAQTSKPSQAAIAGENYVVKKGDSLWSISESAYKSGYNWVNIAAENKISNPNLIEEDARIIIPKVTPIIIASVARVESTPAPSAVPESRKIIGAEYTVQRGDYLWDIAIRAYADGYKWVEIAQVNNLANPDIIHAGNKFKIPR